MNKWIDREGKKLPERKTGYENNESVNRARHSHPYKKLSNKNKNEMKENEIRKWWTKIKFYKNG